MTKSGRRQTTGKAPKVKTKETAAEKPAVSKAKAKAKTAPAPVKASKAGAEKKAKASSPKVKAAVRAVKGLAVKAKRAVKKVAAGPARGGSRKMPVAGSTAATAVRIRSIPADVVLAPSAEAPRQALSGHDQSRGPKGVRELSWKEFDGHIESLARSVARSFAPQSVVGVAHGGVFVGGAVAGALGCDFFPVRISRRSRDVQSGGQKISEAALPSELRGRSVLIVDDIASSGDTLELAVRLAHEAGATEVKTAVLVQRQGGYAPDYQGFITAGLVVFPWDYEPVAGGARFSGNIDEVGV